MITKKRLKEIIDKRGEIYTIHESVFENPCVACIEIDWDYTYIIEDNCLTVTGTDYVGEDFCSEYSLLDLYEHKADAEWELEFGNVKRTDRLDLPRWEELKPEKFVKENADKEFVTQDIVEFEASKDIHTLALCVNENNEFNIELSSDTGEFYQSFEFSKDGYKKACRLTKEIFLKGVNYERKHRAV